MATKLTVAFVRLHTEALPPARATAWFDTALPRFYLRVKPPAKPGQPWPATYFVKYVAPDGRRRAIKVGNPRTMDLDAARAAARKLLGKVDTGGDPAAERAAAREVWTVRQAVATYRSSTDFTKRAVKGRSIDGRIFDNHIVHHIGAEKIAAIDVPAIRRLLRKVEADRRVNSRRRKLGGPGIARKVSRVLSSLLTWCVGEGQIKTNPLIGNLRLTGDGQRDVIMGTPEEYARLYTILDDLVASGEPPLRPYVRAFVIIAALTGMRRGELQHLRWGHVDLEKRRLTLHGTKGVTLARSGPQTETVSLPWRAAEALASIRPEDALPNELVFVPLRGERISVNRDWNRIREAAGLPVGLTLHGLRHSVGTAAVIAGLSLPEIQKLLRHRNVSTTAKYIHLAERHQSRFQDRATAHLDPEPAQVPAKPQVA